MTYKSFCTFIVLLILLKIVSANVIYVDAAKLSIPDNDGSTWEKAFHDIAPAIALANSNDTIWIAKGTYRIIDEAGGDTFPVNIDKSITIIGGFLSGAKTVDERDCKNDTTYIQPTSNPSSYTNLFSLSAGGNTVKLDGITFLSTNTVIATENIENNVYLFSQCNFIDLLQADDIFRLNETNVDLSFSNCFFRNTNTVANIVQNQSSDNVLSIANTLIKNNVGAFAIYKGGKVKIDSLVFDSCSVSDNLFQIDGASITCKKLYYTNSSGSNIFSAESGIINGTIDSVLISNSLFGSFFSSNTSDIELSNIAVLGSECSSLLSIPQTNSTTISNIVIDTLKADNNVFSLAGNTTINNAFFRKISADGNQLFLSQGNIVADSISLHENNASALITAVDLSLSHSLCIKNAADLLYANTGSIVACEFIENKNNKEGITFQDNVTIDSSLFTKNTLKNLVSFTNRATIHKTRFFQETITNNLLNSENGILNISFCSLQENSFDGMLTNTRNNIEFNHTIISKSVSDTIFFDRNSYGGLKLIHSVLYANESAIDTIYVSKNNTDTIVNSIFLENDTMSFFSDEHISHSCFDFYVPSENVLINTKPLFVDAELGDFHLECGSPAINQGDNSVSTYKFDFADTVRVQEGTVDMGIYETHYRDNFAFFESKDSSMCFDNTPLHFDKTAEYESFQWFKDGESIGEVNNEIAPQTEGNYYLQLQFNGCLQFSDTIAIQEKACECIVTTTASNGNGSLLEAVNCANNKGEASTILFDIKGDGPHTIVLNNPLPDITQPIFIDGLSQSGDGIQIILQGNGGSDDCFVFTSTADGSKVEGIRIDNFQRGIVKTSAGKITISQCKIEHCVQGIVLENANNSFIANNSIINNSETGILLNNVAGITTIQNNTVTGNGIDGMQCLSSEGVVLQENTIGQNINNGISCSDACTNITIANNYIGTNVAGDDLGNKNGIYLDSIVDTKILNNSIAFNTTMGVHLQKGTENTISQNRIFQNGSKAIFLEDGANDTILAPFISAPSFTNNECALSIFSSSENATIEIFSSDNSYSNAFEYIDASVEKINDDEWLASFPWNGDENRIFTATVTDENGNTSELGSKHQICSTTVTNANNSGDGSLRSAIECANESNDTSTILFDIPQTGIVEIVLNEPLPLLQWPTIIDGALQEILINGNTQQFNGIESAPETNAYIAIKNIALKNFSNAIAISSEKGNYLLSNITVTDCIDNAFSISNVSDTLIIENCNAQNCKNGIAVHNCNASLFQISSSSIRGNSENGILLNNSSISSISNNIIGENDEYGISIVESSAGSILGNYIGTNANSEDLGNKNNGINSVNGTATIGDGTSNNANVIGYNVKDGISGDGISVLFNYIGIDKNLGNIGNKQSGIAFLAGEGIQIRGNYIGFNNHNGIYNSAGMFVNNYIGSDGANIFGNMHSGIFTSTNATLIIDSCIIGNNAQWGVDCGERSTTIHACTFINNALGGINSEDIAYEVSKTMFKDTKERAIKNPNRTVPSIDSYHQTSSTLHLQGTAEAFDTIEIFIATAEPQSTISYIDTTVALDNGLWSKNISQENLSKNGEIYFAVTARGKNEGTSELSFPFQIPFVESTTFVVTNTNDSGEGSLRNAIIACNEFPDFNTIQFEIPEESNHTITIESLLPTISAPCAIAGNTQFGSMVFIRRINNAIQNCLTIQSNNVIIDSIGIQNFGSGINAPESIENITIKNCSLSEITEPAIQCNNVSHVEIINNSIKNITNSGIDLKDASDVVIANNSISKVNNNGILLSGGIAITLEKNRITQFVNKAISLENGANASIEAPAMISQEYADGIYSLQIQAPADIATIELFTCNPDSLDAIKFITSDFLFNDEEGLWETSFAYEEDARFSATVTDKRGNTSELGRLIIPDCYRVTSSNDSGIGSLREAINCANADPDTNIIVFDLLAGYEHIELASELPEIQYSCSIVGENSTTGNAISIQGTGSGAGLLLAPVDGAEISISILSISQFENGVVLSGRGNCTVENCEIYNNTNGVAVTNKVSGLVHIIHNYIRNNARQGVEISNAKSFTISENIVGSNGKSGLKITSSKGSITNNYIGLSEDFTNIGNGVSGIYILETNNAENYITIAENHIGFNQEGLSVQTGIGDHVLVTNNFIGGDGDHVFGNILYGISGDVQRVENCIISNNGTYGIHCTSANKITKTIFVNNADSAISNVDIVGNVVAPPTIDSYDFNIPETVGLAGTSRAYDTVEIFLSDTISQNATAYLATAVANEKGKWHTIIMSETEWNANSESHVIATATNSQNETSEFSNIFKIPVPKYVGYVVTTVNDTGLGSLRAAIDFCENQDDTTNIYFDIKEIENPIIALESSLEIHNNSCVIQGASQNKSNGTSITIQGANSATPIFTITGNSSNIGILDVALTNAQNAIEIIENTGAVEIINCTFDNFENAGILIDSSKNVTLQELQISGNTTSTGIVAHNAETIIISNVTIENNGTGLLIDSTRSTQIFSSSINGNEQNGIRISSSTNINVSKSTLLNNNGNGIEITGISDTVLLLSNYIGFDTAGVKGGNTVGIAIKSDSENVLIAANTIGNNTGNGIVVENNLTKTNILIQENFIGTTDDHANIGNAGNGVLIEKGNDITLLKNTIRNNAENGIAIIEGTGNTISKNTFQNNRGGKAIVLPDNALHPPVIESIEAMSSTSYYLRVSGSEEGETVEVFIAGNTLEDALFYSDTLIKSGETTWEGTIITGTPNPSFIVTLTDSNGTTSAFGHEANSCTTVVNTNDSGTGSFRNALECANENPDYSTIIFDIETNGNPIVLTPQTAYPAITAPLSIIGGNTDSSLVIDGTSLHLEYGLAFTGTNGSMSYKSYIAGIKLANFSNGILIDNFDNIDIVNVSATKNISAGIAIDAISNTISIEECTITENGYGIVADSIGNDTLTISSSTISLNKESGIVFSATDAFISLEDNMCSENNNGVEITGGSIVQLSENVLSENKAYGLSITNAESAEISNNYIGTSQDFDSLPNGKGGIYMNRVRSNLGGDTVELFSNIILSNLGNGITIDSSAVWIHQNYIGISPLWENGGNSGAGIEANEGSTLYCTQSLVGNNASNGIVFHAGSIKNSCIGVTPGGKSMSNNGSGILNPATADSIVSCIIGFNGMHGISGCDSAVIVGNCIGGTKSADWGNAYWGISGNAYENIELNTISNNGSGAIHIANPQSTLISNNVFTGQNVAIEFGEEGSHPAPVIKTHKIEGSTIEIQGTAQPFDSIEVFSGTESPHDALYLLETIQADSIGAWAMLLHEGEYWNSNESYTYIATATDTNGITSTLSNVYRITANENDTIVVTNVNDSGEGSLRNALKLVKSGSVITFNIPEVLKTDGKYTIELLSKLPPITESIEILGLSQPDSDSLPIITITGEKIESCPCFALGINKNETIQGSYISGLSFENFSYGIQTVSSVENMMIGFCDFTKIDAGGIRVTRTDDAVLQNCNMYDIGGTCVYVEDSRHLIIYMMSLDSCRGPGINLRSITYAMVTDSKITNSANSIVLSDLDTASICKNLIGINEKGEMLGNHGEGIAISDESTGSHSIIIGNNYIVNSKRNGIYLNPMPNADIRIENNQIGTYNGKAMGNGENGIYLDSISNNITIVDNSINYNTNGIYCIAGTGNTFSRNTFVGNKEKPIYLENLSNIDAWANNSIRPPSIVSVVEHDISYAVSILPSASNFRAVELFESSENKQDVVKYIVSFSPNAEYANYNAETGIYHVFIPKSSISEANFLATITDTLGNTSEFNSPCLVVTNTNDNGPGSLRSAIECANYSADLSIITFDFDITQNTKIISLETPLPSIYTSTFIQGPENDSLILSTTQLLPYGLTFANSNETVARLSNISIEKFDNGIVANNYSSLKMNGVHLHSNTKSGLLVMSLQDSLIIENSSFTDNGSSGIQINSCSLDYVRITNSTVSNNQLSGITSKAQAKYAELLGSSFYSNATGIEIIDGTFARIQNNEIGNSSNSGILVQNSIVGEISNNVVGADRDCKNIWANGTGIFIDSKNNTTIANNTIVASENNGIYIASDSAVLVSNYIGLPEYAMQYDTISFSTTDSTELAQIHSQLALFANDSCGIYAHGVGNLVIMNNHICNNGKHGIEGANNSFIADNTFGNTSEHIDLSNKGYGIYADNPDIIEMCIFNKNNAGSIYIQEENTSILRCIFTDKSNSKAIHIESENKNARPEFTPQTCKITADTVILTGKANAGDVVEIFFADTVEQTALQYIGNAIAGTDNMFSLTFSKKAYPQYGGIDNFSAIATNSNGASSELSKLFNGNFSLCNTDHYLVPQKAVTLCQGQDFSLIDKKDMAMYKWFKDGSTLHTNKVFSIHNAAPSDAAKYSLYVKDAKGCELRQDFTIDVVELDFGADFLMATHAALNDRVILIEISNLEPDSVKWNLGNAKFVLNTEIPTIEFAEEGINTIRLISYKEMCADTIKKDIYIDPILEKSGRIVYPYQIDEAVVFPNPFRSGDAPTLAVEVSDISKINVHLFNAEGDVLESHYYFATDESDLNLELLLENDFNIHERTAGTYYLRIDAGSIGEINNGLHDRTVVKIIKAD